MPEENENADLPKKSPEETEDIREGKFFACIGYFSFLCFVPLYFKKDSRFALFHGKQALVLFILELAAGIIAVIPFLGPLVSWLAFLVFGLVSLFGIYKALSEEYWEMPFIYEIAEKIRV